MRHRHTISGLAAALGLLVALPACAQDQERGEQIIGPAPVIGCCWGNAPNWSAPDAAGSDLATVPAPRRGWLRREGQE